VGQATRHQLREHETGLDRLPEPHAVRQQEADPAHPDRAENGDELIRLETQPARLRSQKRIRPQRLLQKERLVIHDPVGERRGPVRTRIVNDRLDGFERMEKIQLLPGRGARQSPQTVEHLRAESLGVHDLPPKPSGLNFRSGEQRCQWALNAPLELFGNSIESDTVAGMMAPPGAGCKPRRPPHGRARATIRRP
jgi:hypothetical protein